MLSGLDELNVIDGGQDMGTDGAATDGTSTDASQDAGMPDVQMPPDGSTGTIDAGPPSCVHGGIACSGTAPCCANDASANYGKCEPPGMCGSLTGDT